MQLNIIEIRDNVIRDRVEALEILDNTDRLVITSNRIVMYNKMLLPHFYRMSYNSNSLKTDFLFVVEKELCVSYASFRWLTTEQKLELDSFIERYNLGENDE